LFYTCPYFPLEILRVYYIYEIVIAGDGIKMVKLREIDLNDFTDYHRTFLSNAGGEDGMRVKYFLTEEGNLYAKVHFGKRSMGPPGHVHGGAMGAVLDEAMGVACWFKMLPVVTMSLNIRYIRMLPLGTEAHLETSVKEGEGKNVHVLGRLFHPETGVDFTVAKGVYRQVDIKKMGDSGMMVLDKLME
jgi:acyl-coenzyme A thioesterase PaaI-like protein